MTFPGTTAAGDAAGFPRAVWLRETTMDPWAAARPRWSRWWRLTGTTTGGGEVALRDASAVDSDGFCWSPRVTTTAVATHTSRTVTRGSTVPKGDPPRRRCGSMCRPDMARSLSPPRRRHDSTLGSAALYPGTAAPYRSAAPDTRRTT